MKLPNFLLRSSGFSSELIIASLGKLEREIMETIWQSGEISVRHAFDVLNQRIAYTTIMTTLDRLYKKGFLERRKVGRAFLYQPLYSREELERNIAENVIGNLLGGSTEKVEPVLSCIVDVVSDCDRDLLDELERLVHEKRRELSNND